MILSNVITKLSWLQFLIFCQLKQYCRCKLKKSKKIFSYWNQLTLDHSRCVHSLYFLHHVSKFFEFFGVRLWLKFLFQGGLKAVVWTDTVQTVMMFAALIAVVFMGIDSVGGLSEVWRRNEAGDRLEFFKYGVIKSDEVIERVGTPVTSYDRFV